MIQRLVMQGLCGSHMGQMSAPLPYSSSKGVCCVTNNMPRRTGRRESQPHAECDMKGQGVHAA